MQRLCAMLLVSAVSGVLACALCAQTGATVQSRARSDAGFTFISSFSAPQPGPSIVGAPYCGVEVREHRQQLADGTNIVRSVMPPVFKCRDSQGRTRIEHPPGPAGQPDQTNKIVEITDPVAGMRYVIDSFNGVVHESRFPPRPVRDEMPARISRPARPPETTSRAQAPAAGRSDRVLPSSTTENLGTSYIDGVMVEGRKMTTTVPAGMRGNDQPIVTTSENWLAPDLRLTILSKSFNPLSGETSSKIVNLSRSEPDPALFQLPPDYKVVEERGSFVIQIERP